MGSLAVEAVGVVVAEEEVPQLGYHHLPATNPA